MKNQGISRRDCLVLLGTGAATFLSIRGRAQGVQKKEPTAKRVFHAASITALSSNAEQLKELWTSRVYAANPIQARREYDGTSSSGGEQITLNDGWELAEAADSDTPGQYSPETTWIKVQMPRPLQYALWEAGQISQPWLGENFRSLQWIQQRDWYLRYRFRIPATWQNRAIRLQFDGLDYLGMVWLDGDFLGAHEGAFGGPTFDITNRVTASAEHELLVRLVHEPHDLLVNFANDASENHHPRVVKPDAEDAESYQWGNRYRTMGLYQPIRLVATGQACLEAPFVRTDEIAPDAAKLWVQVMLNNTGAAFEGTIRGRIIDLSNGATVWETNAQQAVAPAFTFWEKEITLRSPKLWWPNGLGEQPLYLLEVELWKNGSRMDAITSRFGVRTLELGRNPDSPDSPRVTASDKTIEDEAYRYLWVVNGRPFYVKGACWMASDDLLLLSREREEWMIRAAKLGGLNMLRLNGGTSILETEQFYNLCDEQGILVWQEVPLNWAESAGTTRLDVWREQLTLSALRMRQHPSLALYVGGNEYDPFADGVEPLLGLVREIFASYDGARPFRMNSPCGGDYHAYEPEAMYTGDTNWYHKLFNRGHYFISEWSFSSFANLSQLKRIIPESELRLEPAGFDVEAFKRRFPIIRDRSAELGYTFIKSWQRASWYGDFGKADIEHLVDYSQMAYEHTAGCVMEQWRAQFPFTGGDALWTYNSLGPVAASWHIIDWFGQPQIPFYAAKRAHEPVHVMADTGFFSWGPGDTFRAAVFAVNDRELPLKNARIRVRIFDQQMRPAREQSWTLEVPSSGYRSASREIQWPIPSDMPEGYFFLELTLWDAQGTQLSRRAYWLRVLRMLADPAARKQWQSAPVAEPLNQTGPWLRPQVERLKTSVHSSVELLKQTDSEAEISVSVRNTGSVPAYAVRIEVIPDVYSSLWTDNFFWLAPGEAASVRGTVRLDMRGLDPVARPKIASPTDLTVRASAWNAEASEMRVPSGASSRISEK